jgi:uncharacterized protein YndB with AHSA1/START domain
MTNAATVDAYGVVSEPMTVKIERLLPGPIERVWSYLTESELRRQWLAAGKMDLTPGASFELVWRNDELNENPGKRPDGFSAESRMTCEIIAVDPPRKLSFTWEDGSDVTFDLTPKGRDVLLTITHHRISDRPNLLGISAGWHAHLEMLAARAAGNEPPQFWETWSRLRKEYERRIPE